MDYKNGWPTIYNTPIALCHAKALQKYGFNQPTEHYWLGEEVVTTVAPNAIPAPYYADAIRWICHRRKINLYAENSHPVFEVNIDEPKIYFAMNGVDLTVSRSVFEALLRI